MNSFSFIEQQISNILSNFPNLKRRVKFIYQNINYFFYKKNYVVKSPFKVKEVSDNYHETFFGYYDKDPFNNKRNLVLFHALDEKKAEEEPVKVICQNFSTGEIEKEFESYAFNYQQGTRLHWLNNEKFIFNDFNFQSKSLCSKIFNVTNKEVTNLSSPIYDTYKDEFALTLNFNRLSAFTKDYGYKIKELDNNVLQTQSDGIWKINLFKNTSELVISLDEIISLEQDDVSKEAFHTLNHIMISPDGKNFIFIHRWYENSVRKDSLFLVNIDLKEIKRIARGGIVSHCCWAGNNALICYLENDLGLGYQFFDIFKQEFKFISENLNKFGDGHPNFSQGYIITDTYPNRSRIQSLLRYSFETKKIEVIGEFFSGMEFIEERRCDLHPRISYGNRIFFDSSFSGRRRFYSLDL